MRKGGLIPALSLHRGSCCCLFGYFFRGIGTLSRVGYPLGGGAGGQDRSEVVDVLESERHYVFLYYYPYYYYYYAATVAVVDGK